jgi:hypothetical protein
MTEQRAFFLSLAGMTATLVFASLQNSLALALCAASFAESMVFLFWESALHVRPPH